MCLEPGKMLTWQMKEKRDEYEEGERERRGRSRGRIMRRRDSKKQIEKENGEMCRKLRCRRPGLSMMMLDSRSQPSRLPPPKLKYSSLHSKQVRP